MQFGDSKMRYFIIKSDAKNAPTIGDAKILHLAWDTTNMYWDTQIAISEREYTGMQIRGQTDGTWTPWYDIYDSNRFPLASTTECQQLADSILK